MILRRLAEGIRKQDWFTVVLEVLIVVVGIFLGLQVDDWNEARKDRATEAAYLQELLEDFETNDANLDQSIGQYQEIIVAMIGLLEQSAMDTPDWSVSQLNNAFRNIHKMPTFFDVERTFANLTGSGDLRLIRNRDIKNAIAQYQSAADLVELVQNTHELELVQTFQPYVIENMDFQAVHHQRIEDYPLPSPVEEGRILEVLNSREFRNILTQKWTISTDLLNQHRNMRVRTTAIIDMIKAEIAVSARDGQ